MEKINNKSKKDMRGAGTNHCLCDGLHAAKGGSEVGLGSVDQGGPAGGRCPQVCNQLPD